MQVEEVKKSNQFKIKAILKNWPYLIALALIVAIVSTGLLGNLAIFNLIIRLRYLFVIFFIFCLVLKIDSRFIIAISLSLFLSCGAFLVKGSEDKANLLALVAYGLLAIGVFAQIVEYLKEKREL